MIKICILDSGYDFSQLQKYGAKITGINFTNEEISLVECTDLIGHGTAIIDTILKTESNTQIIMCKIFEEQPETDEDKLIYILEYIYENVECDILHMSFGITVCAQCSRLKKICDDFTAKNTIIVSAFDNMGSVSYPAAFDNVIGVDSCKSSYAKNNYTFVENSIVNVDLNIGMRRITVNNEQKIFIGSSFSAAYITGLIAKMLSSGIEKEMVMAGLKKNSHKVIDRLSSREGQKSNKPFDSRNIKKVIIFPFNKEMHSLVRYSNMLSFDIDCVYDIKFGGKVGRTVSSILQNFPDDAEDFTVKDYLNIDWESDFDTVVLGHVNKISSVLNINLLEYFIEKCKEYNKKLFCFDQNSDIKAENIYFANISSYDFKDTYDKYFKVAAPVLSVFGTSSSQGKFSLQLQLRKLFLENDFRVGQLGTEPQSELFGFDYSFPFGYGTKNSLDDISQSLLISNMISEIDHKEVDVIICGSQSGTIPYELNNTIQSTFPQMVFAGAIKPDISILCINPYDEIEYIKRSIYFLESIAGNKVLALVLFPIQKIFFPSGFSKNQLLNNEELEALAKTLNKELKINVFTMKANSIKALYDSVISYLS